MKRLSILFLCISLVLLMFSLAYSALDVPLTVKEVAGVGAQASSVTVVVPLGLSQYYDVNRFRVVDISGNTVPAQFDILTKWWANDNSIRHLKIEFQPTVGAFTSVGTGISTYYLKDDGAGNNASTPLSVKDSQGYIEVITGPLKFTVNKTNFNIIDELWLDSNNDRLFEAEEQIIASNLTNGGIFTGRLSGDIQYDTDRQDVQVVIEESGPMRVVIKASAPTYYYDTSNHTHGFAIRIYTYANKPYIKIDYQLQNSAKNKEWAWPLYFKEMRLDFALNLGNSTVRIDPGDGNLYQGPLDTGLILKQKTHNQVDVHNLSTDTLLDTNTFTNDWLSKTVTSAFIDITDSTKGVLALTRNFWQMFPNGLSIDSNNKLTFQLWPNWSCQWEDEDGTFIGGISGTPCAGSAGQIYWLDDMQHSYKEIFLYFHNANVSENELKSFAKTIQYHPVAVLPIAQYQKTKATLDMGGFIPFSNSSLLNDQRRFIYSANDFNTAWTQYKFGWDNYYFYDKNRKFAPSTAGGGPQTSSYFIVTEDPKDYYYADMYSMSEINIMPESMLGYQYETDFPFLGLTQHPYGGSSWRAQKSPPWDADYLPGTWQMKKPRDDQHGWFYHVEEAYYFTANPWIKDWYEFIGEFRKGTLDDYTVGSTGTRGIAHMFANALQAYRVTGDKAILDKSYNYLNTYLRAVQDPYYGSSKTGGAGSGPSESAFQAGFLTRAMISLLEEVKNNNPQTWADAFQYVSGYMEWNYNFSNFSYYLDASSGQIGVSNGTSWTLVDPQAWYYLNTGRQKYLTHLNQYIDTGINGGDKPYMDPDYWRGQFEGRFGHFVRYNTKPDTTPPAKITDFAAARTGENVINLVWGAPQDTKRYHIVYSDKPISENTTTDTAYCNWWAAKAIGPNLTPTPGKTEQLTLQLDQSKAKYLAIFSFDENENMSEMSNLAPVLDVLDTTDPSIPQGLSGSAQSDTQINLSWQASTDLESGVLKYKVYRNGSFVGESNTTSFTDKGLLELTTYTYEVSAVNGAYRESGRSAQFQITTRSDVISPTITLVNSTLEPTKVTVIFSEPVELTSAANALNYSINNNILIFSATLQPDLKTVILTTSTHTSGITYTLTVSNIKDRAQTPNTIAPNTTKTYTFNSGLLLYWKFDEASGTTVQDSSGNGNTASLMNNPLWTQGYSNFGLSFDGKGRYVRSSTVVNTANVTISAWVKLSTVPSSNQMIAGFLNGLSSSTHDKELFIDTSAKLRFYVYSGGEKTTPAPVQAIPLDEWVFVTGTADGVNAKTYVNAQEVGSTPISGSTYTGYTLPNIFVSGDNSPTPDITFFNGLIDEVRIYNRALTSSEILELYNSTGTAPGNKADVNNDSKIDILDIQALVNHILGTQDYGSSADANNDGSVDVLDVQLVVNIILG